MIDFIPFPSVPFPPILLTEYKVDEVSSVYSITVLVQRYFPALTEGIEELQTPVGIVVPLEDD